MTFDIKNLEEHFWKKKKYTFFKLKKICWMMILDIKNQDLHINISIY